MAPGLFNVLFFLPLRTKAAGVIEREQERTPQALTRFIPPTTFSTCYRNGHSTLLTCLNCFTGWEAPDTPWGFESGAELP